jgi:hypothetical protein
MAGTFHEYYNRNCHDLRGRGHDLGGATGWWRVYPVFKKAWIIGQLYVMTAMILFILGAAAILGT